MLAVVGTVPDPDFPLAVGRVDMVGDKLRIDGKLIRVYTSEEYLRHFPDPLIQL